MNYFINLKNYGRRIKKAHISCVTALNISGNITIGTYSNNIPKLSLQKQVEMELKLPYFTLFNRRLFSPSS